MSDILKEITCEGMNEKDSMIITKFQTSDQRMLIPFTKIEMGIC